VEADHQIDRVLTELKTGEAILEVHIRDLQAATGRRCVKVSQNSLKSVLHAPLETNFPVFG